MDRLRCVKCAKKQSLKSWLGGRPPFPPWPEVCGTDWKFHPEYSQERYKKQRGFDYNRSKNRKKDVLCPKCYEEAQKTENELMEKYKQRWREEQRKEQEEWESRPEVIHRLEEGPKDKLSQQIFQWIKKNADSEVTVLYTKNFSEGQNTYQGRMPKPNLRKDMRTFEYNMGPVRTLELPLNCPSRLELKAEDKTLTITQGFVGYVNGKGWNDYELAKTRGKETTETYIFKL